MRNTFNLRVRMLSKALSPICHHSGHEGNEAVLMREPVAVDGGFATVPVLSGNALRSRMLRQPLARHLCDTLELSGRLSVKAINFLFHGGTLTEKGGRYSLADQNALFHLFPFFRLLGCSLPGQIVAGSVYCQRGLLFCRENTSRLEHEVGEDVGLLPPAAQFVSGYQYVRAGRMQSANDVEAADEVEAEDDTRMIFAGQSVTAGALFWHGLTARHINRVEAGALFLGLRLWQDAGGTIGGKASIGHGRLKTWADSSIEDEDDCIEEYINHVQENGESIIGFLGNHFAVQETEAAK